MAAFDQDDLRADMSHIADTRAGLDPEGFRLIAGRDGNCRVGKRRHDREWTVAVLGMKLLLHRRKEAVQVDVNETETVVL